jgi:hypothetical protein
MGDRIRLALSAAFYLLALAATMSGLISQWFAAVLAVIATALLVWAGYHYAREWHIAKKNDGKQGLDSWYFIAPCLGVAIIAIAAAAYGFGLRSSAGIDTAKAKSDGIVSAPLIKGPRLDWDASGRLSLQGRYTRQGGPISVYVTYESIGSAITRRPNAVLGGAGSIEPRIKVDSLSHFDEDEMADLTLGFVIDDNGKILQWGQPQQNKTKVGITFASYFGNVILVSSDGKNVESYPFAIISTSDQQVTGANASPPIMIGPDILIEQQHRK